MNVDDRCVYYTTNPVTFVAKFTEKGSAVMLMLIFFFLWSLIGLILGFILKLIFHILPIKTIIALCLIGYGLHMLGIHFI